jgi:ribosomal protein S18
MSNIIDMIDDLKVDDLKVDDLKVDDLKVDDFKVDDLKDDKVYDLTVNNFNVDESEKINDILTQDSNKLITFASHKIDELRGILQGMEPSFFNEKIEHIQDVFIQKIELLKSHTNIMFDNDVSDVLQIFRQELTSLSQEFMQVLEKDYELLKSYISEHKRIIETDYLQLEQRWYKSHILVLGANYSNNDVKFWSRIDINYIGLGIDTSNANVKTRFQNNWNSPNYWNPLVSSKVFNVIYIDRFSLYKICKDGQLDNFLQFINHYRNKETKLLITKNEMDKIENDKIENNPIFNDALKYFLENKWVYTMDVKFTQLFTNTTWITSLEHKDIENREKWTVFEFM